MYHNGPLDVRVVIFVFVPSLLGNKLQSIQNPLFEVYYILENIVYNYV
jgi:hypothetical protein